MKRFEYIFFSLIFLGILLKFFLMPGGALLMALSTMTLSTIYLVRIVWKRKDEFDTSLMGITATTWALYFISRIQYWPSILFLGLALISSFIFLIRVQKIVPSFGFRFYVLLFFFLASATLFMSKWSDVHFFMKLSKPFHSNNYEVGFTDWDKQSWFLYKEENYDRAAWANEMAQMALENYFLDNEADSAMFVRLQENKDKISNRNWESFSVLEYYGPY